MSVRRRGASSCPLAMKAFDAFPILRALRLQPATGTLFAAARRRRRIRACPAHDADRRRPPPTVRSAPSAARAGRRAQIKLLAMVHQRVQHDIFRHARAVRSPTATRTSGTSGGLRSAISASTPAPRLKMTRRFRKPREFARRGLPDRGVIPRRDQARDQAAAAQGDRRRRRRTALPSFGRPVL